MCSRRETLAPCLTKKRKYRSAAWFFQDRQRRLCPPQLDAQSGDCPTMSFDGRPVIGICNTWSELTPCNAHFRQIAERVKRGVWEAGGFPLEFSRDGRWARLTCAPLPCCFRNLVSMDVEESIRAKSHRWGRALVADAIKLHHRSLWGAASCNIPALVVFRRPHAERQVPWAGYRFGDGRMALQ